MGERRAAKEASPCGPARTWADKGKPLDGLRQGSGRLWLL